MTTNPKPDTAKNEIEAVLEAAGQIAAPVLQRLGQHQEKVALIVKELESERYTLQSQRDTLTRAYEAAMSGLNMHIADVDAATDLYLRGLNGLPADGSKAIE